MLSEFRKSISAVLYERMTSPLYGTLIISWLIWNWKIVYLTLFISESSIDSTKIDYIIENYCNIHALVTLPLISSALLITVVPFISNGAYWLSLKFDKWRSDKKNEIERSKLLTLEQSIQIRNEMSEQEEKFKKSLDGNENEIKILKGQVVELTSTSALKEGQKKGLRILRATYGTKEKPLLDVTKQISKLIKNNRLAITVANSSVADGRDPHPGKIKTLEILYEINGEVKTITAEEGQEIVIES